MDWFELTQSLSMASFREHYLPLGLSGAPWSGCSCFGASARTRFPRILSKVRVGSCLNSESFDSLAPAHLKLAPSPTRSLLPSQFYLLCRFSHKLHSTSLLNPSMSLAISARQLVPNAWFQRARTLRKRDG